MYYSFVHHNNDLDNHDLEKENFERELEIAAMSIDATERYIENLGNLIKSQPYLPYIPIPHLTDGLQFKRQDYSWLKYDSPTLLETVATKAWNTVKRLAMKKTARVITAVMLTGTPLEYQTHIVEKVTGTVCFMHPHKEQGRFWEGVHMYYQQREALQDATLTGKVQRFLFGISDIGVIPDVSVIEHYPLSRDNSVRFRTADGNVFYEKQATQIFLDTIPQNVSNAIVWSEDEAFYRHAGINWRGIGSAIYHRGKNGGGSSIEMQIAKQLALDRTEQAERSITRKIRDMLGAVELDVRYDKDTLLRFYANYMYFGSGNYGIETASLDYFGRHAEELELNEAIFLACLLNDPGNNPKTKAGFEIQWKDYVKEIKKLQEKGYITRKQASAWLKRDAIQIQQTRGSERSEIGSSMYASATQSVYYFLDMRGVHIRQAIDPSERFYSIDLTTTIGPVTTAAAYNAMHRSNIPKIAEASIVVLDEHQRIKAIIGTKKTASIDQAGALPNTAIKRRRPFGSTFKPLYFSYAENRGIVERYDMFDEGTVYKDSNGKEVPRNWDGLYDRTLSLSDALIKSSNRIAVQVYDEVRHNLLSLEWARFTDYLARIGIDTKTQFQDNNDWTYALGTQSATSLELAEAYNNVFNQAAHCQPWIIEKIQIGNTIIKYACEESATLEKESAFGNTLEIIAQNNNIRNPYGVVGIKTGTTSDALVTRIAGYYQRKGVDYAFVVDVDGQGKSLGGYASEVAGPIARRYFQEMR